MRMRTIEAAIVALAISYTAALAETPADLNDLEIAHVAFTVNESDIRYAHLALAISKDPNVHEFARTMIRDHAAVNERALQLLDKLQVQPADNFLSQQLNETADALVVEMSQLTDVEFDRRYAENELEYHKAANDLVENTFIPIIENPEVKALFEEALAIFKTHENHAEMMVDSVAQRQAIAQ